MKKKLLKACAVGTMAAVIFMGSAAVDAESGDTYIKSEYVAYCQQVSEELGVSEEILEAMVEVESNGQASIVSDKDAVGLCQIRPKYSKYTREQLMDPYTNIYAAAETLKSFDCEDIADALCCYNCGQYSDTAKKYVGSGMMTDYAKKIIERAYELEEVHGKHCY